jgi:uncharacterized membrane protein
MTFLLMVIGAALGAYLCAGVFDEPTGFTGALFGLIAGLMIAQWRRLRARIAKLEADLALATRTLPATAAGLATPSPAVKVDTPTTPDRPAADVATPLSAGASAAAGIAADNNARAEIGASASASMAPPVAPRPATPAAAIQTAMPTPPRPESAVASAIKRWFTEGNVPVKVGVIVLFLGVAALLKYAADQGWLTVPIELRLAGIGAAALAALLFAWRKRESHRAFALSLQGGAIGVLILTLFAAYRLYALLPPAFAFALLVVVVAGAGALAVLQDSLALALLGIVGGFLAPILISTGSNNHVALFSYYAVLNAAIFAIAWVKPWRALNLVGFAFTFGIGTLWGVLGYRPELFASTEPFLLLFFAFYLLLPLLYALRLAPQKRDLIDGSLVFGTPLIAFALQAALLNGDRMQLAYSALIGAAIYAGLAALELRRWRLTLLGESHALLALGLATLAVPLALSARATACTFALEGVALVWLGLRQQRRVPRWIGYALQALAGCAFVAGQGGAADPQPILNGAFFVALILALAGLVSSRLLARSDLRTPLATAFFAWGALWWYVAGGNEIDRFVHDTIRWNWWLALFAVSALIAAEVHRRFDWRECLVPAAAAIPLGLPFIALTTLSGHGPLEGWAVAAWALWLLAAWSTLPAVAAVKAAAARILHVVYLWIVVLLIGAEFAHLADRHFGLSEVWIGIAALLPAAALFVLALQRARPARWPLGAGAEVLRSALLASLTILLGLGWLLGLGHEGSPTPLPYVPVVNPLELAQISFLALLALWYRQAEREGSALMSVELRARALALAGLALLTSITLRSVHFLAGVDWSEALLDSPVAEAALSIVWTFAGIAAMLIGQRRGSRAVWFGGAALMAAVLVKLLLIDRQYLHDLPAIIGVLVVGILLVAVGYFAPAPPKSPAAAPTPVGEIS